MLFFPTRFVPRRAYDLAMFFHGLSHDLKHNVVEKVDYNEETNRIEIMYNGLEHVRGQRDFYIPIKPKYATEATLLMCRYKTSVSFFYGAENQAAMGMADAVELFDWIDS